MPTSALHITAKLVVISHVTLVIAGAGVPTPLGQTAAAAASTSATLANALKPPTF